MVSFRMVLFNLLKVRHSPRCSISIGRHTDSIPYIVPMTHLDRVVIGNFCSLAHGIILIVHPGHIPPKDYSEFRVSTYPVAMLSKEGWLPEYELPEKRNFILIGSDVWIGANSIILPGIKIGHGAIIGAGSVVTHNVTPYAIVAGSPARLVRFRYSEDQIRKLLKIAWWNWTDEKIAENVAYFYGEVEKFIEKFFHETLEE